MNTNVNINTNENTSANANAKMNAGENTSNDLRVSGNTDHSLMPLMPWLQRYFANTEAQGIVFLLLLSGIVLYVIGSIVAPVLVSLVIAFLLAAVVRRLESCRCPHLLAVIVVFALFLGILLLTLLLLLPLLWDEMNMLFAATPDMVKHGQKILADLHARYPLLISATRFEQLISGWDLQIASLSKLVWAFSLASLNSVMMLVVYLVLVPLLVFFFLKDGEPIKRWFVRFLPRERHNLQRIGHEVNSTIGSYVQGKMLEMLLVLLASVIAFALLGLPYAILLGTVVGLSVFIPYVGVIIATVPVVIVALLEWGWASQFLYLMIAYTAIITLDANVLVPMLFAEAMSLHPIAIILAVLICGSVGGFWGVFFAIPLVALANVLLKLWPKTH